LPDIEKAPPVSLFSHKGAFYFVSTFMGAVQNGRSFLLGYNSFIITKMIFLQGHNMADLIGKSIERYHILEQIGSGGMANVYKAFDIRLERDVAIKVIRTGLFGTEILDRILKRFEREAKTLARISHPNIVKVLDYGEYQGAPYLVMEYFESGTLKKELGKPMPWREAFQLMLPLISALDYAHQENVIHRDLKPSNILLTNRGQPLLTDFGIAKILDIEEGNTLTGTGMGVGTPEYMSPEQGMGKEVDGRADIYAFGIILYEMITGRKPYTADTPMAVVFKHMSDPLPRPRSFVPDLPDNIEKLLLKAMAKKPEDRYQDMAGLENSINTLLINQHKSQMESLADTADPERTVAVIEGEQSRNDHEALETETVSDIEKTTDNHEEESYKFWGGPNTRDENTTKAVDEKMIEKKTEKVVEERKSLDGQPSSASTQPLFIGFIVVIISALVIFGLRSRSNVNTENTATELTTATPILSTPPSNLQGRWVGELDQPNNAVFYLELDIIHADGDKTFTGKKKLVRGGTGVDILDGFWDGNEFHFMEGTGIHYWGTFEKGKLIGFAAWDCYECGYWGTFELEKSE
jgi:serine/threonine protein kinase